MNTLNKHIKKRRKGIITSILGFIPAFVLWYLLTSFECNDIPGIANSCGPTISMYVAFLASFLLFVIGFIMILVYQVKIYKTKKLLKNN